MTKFGKKIKIFLKTSKTKCKNVFTSETFKEEWVPRLWKLFTSLILLGISIWLGSYYLHNVYDFNKDKHAEFKNVRKSLSHLRSNINKLSALVEIGPRTMSIKKYTSEVKKTAYAIANLEHSIPDNSGDWSFYFGENAAKKGAFFLVWSNKVTRMILKKQYFPPDNLTDRFYSSIAYSIQLQLYSSYNCNICKKLANLSPKKLLTSIAILDYKYPKYQLNNINTPLSYKDIYTLKLLINKFKYVNAKRNNRFRA